MRGLFKPLNALGKLPAWHRLLQQEGAAGVLALPLLRPLGKAAEGGDGRIQRAPVVDGSLAFLAAPYVGEESVFWVQGFL